MPIYLDDFIDILAEICKDNRVKNAVKSSVKGAAVTGAFAGVGGLLLGPLGLALGGALGGLVAASSSDFTPVPEILINMSVEEKERLCQKVVHAFRDFGLQDMAAIAAVVMSQTEMRNLAIRQVQNYLTSEMGLQVCR